MEATLRRRTASFQARYQLTARTQGRRSVTGYGQVTEVGTTASRGRTRGFHLLAVQAKQTGGTESAAHPGRFVKQTVLDPLRLSVTDAAKALGVTRPALSALLNARSSLTPEMALRIEKAFGPTMDVLVRMQSAFDIAQARARAHTFKVERYVERKK